MLTLIFRVGLAGVFALAAVGKAMDLPGSRRAVADFGAPRALAGVIGTALPGVELAIAAALLVQPSARAGAVAALVLLVVFIVAIGRLVAQGAAPDCHCFGQLHSEPAGKGTLARNAILAALAVPVAIAGPGRSLAALSGEDAALLVSSVAFAAAALAALLLWRENRTLRSRPSAIPDDGLPIGSLVPNIALRALDGTTVALGDLVGNGRPSLLVQVGVRCPACHGLMPNLLRWTRTMAGSLRVLTVSFGDLEDNRAFAEQFGAPELLVADGRQLAEALDVRATPSAVYIDEHARIAERPAIGGIAIESLIRTALAPAPR
jgi:uncharacterized membrane protein YphA (DoxX/SURF4 family)/peroxiredoxin